MSLNCTDSIDTSTFHNEHINKDYCQLYNVAVNPLVTRQVRSTLNQEAERAAIDVFASNLKNLLLTPPLRGTTVMAIDPGNFALSFIKLVKLDRVS